MCIRDSRGIRVFALVRSPSPAFRARAQCDRFETPWGGSLGSSPVRWRIPRSGRRTSRRTWWRPRRSARKCACGEIRHRPRSGRGEAFGLGRLLPSSPVPRRPSRRAPSSLTLSRLLRRVRRPQEEKLEPAHQDARVLGQGQDAEHCAYARCPPSSAARNEPRGSLPPCALRAATLPARSRTLPNSPPASSRRSRAARSRARATDRAFPRATPPRPRRSPPSRSLADPPEIALPAAVQVFAGADVDQRARARAELVKGERRSRREPA